MAEQNWREALPQKVRVLQIILGAMFLGCFTLLIMAVLLNIFRQKEAQQSMLTYLALAAAGASFGVWLFAPGILVAQGRKKIGQSVHRASEQNLDRASYNKIDRENTIALQLIQVLISKTIVSYALLEGPIFLLLIVFIVEGGMLLAATAVALLILFIVQTPTLGRTENWMENQIRLVEEERSLV